MRRVWQRLASLRWPALWPHWPAAWSATLAEGWRQGLDWLPPALASPLRTRPVWLILAPVDAGWQLLAHAPESAHPLQDGPIPAERLGQQLAAAWQAVEPEDRRLLLGLPIDGGLVRQLQLPLAARHALAQIAHFELDRQTPFRSDQVYADIREYPSPQAPDRLAAGLLLARLAVVPKPGVDIRLQQLAAQGLAVDGVDLLQAGQPCGFNLLPLARRPRHPRPRRRLNGLLGLGLLLLTLGTAWQWRHDRHLALLQMREVVAGQQIQLQRLAQLQRQWTAQGLAAGFLQRRRQQAPTVLSLLDDLSRRLPDDISLQRLSIGGDGRLSMLGQAPQATHLIDLLKGSRYLQEPAFQGTILRDARSGKERFALTAQLRSAANGGPR